MDRQIDQIYFPLEKVFKKIVKNKDNQKQTTPLEIFRHAAFC